MLRGLTLLLFVWSVGAKKHVLFIVGDDVGYNDIGATNGGKTTTPVLDGLIKNGITMSDYYTFKVRDTPRSDCPRCMSISQHRSWGAHRRRLDYEICAKCICRSRRWTLNRVKQDAAHRRACWQICSPSRAAMLTGRYPWGAGFYDMKADTNHCTKNFTALPEMLKPLGYRTHALVSTS